MPLQNKSSFFPPSTFGTAQLSHQMSWWLSLCLILSACGAKLVAAIRAVLVKGRSSGDAVYAAAEETANELKERICQLHLIQKQPANGSGTGISPARVMYNSSPLVRTFMQNPFNLLQCQLCELTAHLLVSVLFVCSLRHTQSIMPPHMGGGTLWRCLWLFWMKKHWVLHVTTWRTCCLRISPSSAGLTAPASSRCSG